MAVHGQIGSWDEGLALTLELDGLRWLDLVGYDRRVTIEVDEVDRRITVKPDPAGRRVSRRGEHNAVRYGVVLSWESLGAPLLPRFELMPVRFEDLASNAIGVVLPPDHLLPWPRLRPCARYSLMEVAMAEIERRMTSAARSYGPDAQPRHWRWTPPPPEVRSLMSSAWWGEALARARAEATRASAPSP